MRFIGSPNLIKRNALYLVFLLVIIAFFNWNPIAEYEYKEENLPEIETEFRGENAYVHLKKLVTDFPNRIVGTSPSLDSGKWVANYFEKRGLEVIEEPFETKIPSIIFQPIYQEKTIKESYVKVKGLNIIGKSQGEVEDIILIGAHRDIIGTREGAEDNSSGTVVMMELARALTRSPHYFTYKFVSFDGEEVGLKGSYQIAEKLSDKPIKLAISIDMVGIEGADTIGLYPFITKEGQTPLWTVKLARNLNPTGYEQRFVQDKTAYLFEKQAGIIPTDTYPFLKEGFPVLGIYAKDSSLPNYEGRIIHSPHDTIEQISTQTLHMSGKYIETYIKSLEEILIQEREGSIKILENSRSFIPLKEGYIPSWFYFSFLIIFTVLLILLPLNRIIFNTKKPSIILKILRNELKWLLLGISVALTNSFLYQLVQYDIISSRLTYRGFITIIISFIILSLLILILSVFKRSKENHKTRLIDENYNMVLINSLFLIFILTGLGLIGPQSTLAFMLFPVLLLSHQKAPKNIIYRLLNSAGWVIFLIITFPLLMMEITTSLGFYLFSFKTFIIQVWYIFLVFTTGLYKLSS